MKKAIIAWSLLGGLGVVGSLHAQTTWLNALGDPQDASVNTIEVDCANKTAQYQSLDFYMEPAWKGASHKMSTYNGDVKRPMAFRDVTRRLPHGRREEVSAAGARPCVIAARALRWLVACRIGRARRFDWLTLQKGLHAATHCIGRRR